MNILAELQKAVYEEGISKEEQERRWLEFTEKYYALRKKNDRLYDRHLSLETRRKLHKLVLFLYSCENKKHSLTYEVLKDESTETERPIIYVVTHVGKNDIQVISEVLKQHYYLLSGDYEHIQGTKDEIGLGVNGAIYFNERVKEDRREASQKMISHLRRNGNLMYFIEGTWNVTPNLPVLPCYWGIVDVAKKGHAMIVPVAADQYENHFKINVGKLFDMSKYGEGTEEKSQAIGDLRDTLATLKYEIWESFGTQKRDEVDPHEWDDYLNQRFQEWPYFNSSYIKDLIYKPKGVVSEEEVFGFTKLLKPKRENAFLLNKRIHD